MTAESLHADPTLESASPAVLFGYTVLGYLARGSGSMLYYVKHPRRPGVSVLKHVTVSTPKEKRYFHQLRTEFLLSRKIEHPGVRRSIDLHVNRSLIQGVTEAALVMEHCDGYTLEERVPADNTERLCVFLRAAAALAALHDFGYVHCDIKPANIVVKAVAQSTIIDLGQACPIGTVKERIQGTAHFMAPEQARLREITPRTDIYCFGATMYKCLTKRPLPTVMTIGGRSSRTLDGVTAPPHEIDASIPRDLSALVMQCVRADPRERPPDMNAVVNELKQVGANVMRRLETGG